MAETSNSACGDNKLPLSISGESAKTSSANADEDSIILKLNSENTSDAESDSPQSHNKDQHPGESEAVEKKNKTPETIQKTVELDPEKREPTANGKTSPADRKKSNYLWVSNIQRNVKAADLKALFSKVGKVSTAKILTNGKCFYGYVSMESYAVTLKCVKQFNNTMLGDSTIIVSKSRPDLQAPASEGANKASGKRVKKKEDGAEAVEPRPQVKDTVADKTDTAKPVVSAAKPVVSVAKPVVSVAKPVANVEKTDNAKPVAIVEKKSNEEHLQRTVAALRKKVDELIFDNTRLKRKLDAYAKRHDIIRDKSVGLERDIKKLRDENREERRNLEQEKQSFERDRQQTIARIRADREEVAKNLGEVRKLKERLKEAVARSSSPYKRERSPHKRRSSPDRSGKRSRNEDYVPAPPAPKVDPESSRKRYVEVSSVPHFDYRQRPAESSRPSGHWPGPYSREVRSKPLSGYPLSGRYGSVIQQTPSSIVMATRSAHESYYQPW